MEQAVERCVEVSNGIEAVWVYLVKCDLDTYLWTMALQSFYFVDIYFEATSTVNIFLSIAKNTQSGWCPIGVADQLHNLKPKPKT